MKTYNINNISQKLKSIKNRPKYSKRLWRSYTVLIFVFLALISYFVCYFSDRKSEYSALLEKTTLYEKEKSELTTAGDTVDIIVRLITQCDETKIYAKEPTATYENLNFENIYNVSKILKKIQTDFAAYNIDIFITRMSDGMIISGTGNTFSPSGNEFNDINLPDAVSLLEDNEADLPSAVIINKQPKDKASFIYRKIYENAEPIYIFISFSFDKTKFYEDKSGIKYIFNNCSESDMEALEKNLSKADSLFAIEQLKNNGGNSVIYGKIDFIGEKMIYVRSFPEEKDNKLNIIIFIMSLTTILSVALGFIFAQYSYMPIAGILKKIGVGEKDNVDEMHVIVKKIDDIETLNKDMKKKIDDKNAILFRRFLSDLLNGFIWGEELEKEAAEYDVRFICEKCDLFVLKFMGDSYEHHYAFEVVNEMTGVIPNCVTCGMNNGCVAIIFKNNPAIKNEVSEIVLKVSKQFDVRIAFAETDALSGQMAADYKILVYGLENKSLADKKEIITTDDVRGLRKNSLIYSIQSETELKNYCETGERGKALYCLKSLIDSNISGDERVFLSLKYAFTITIKRILSSLNMSESEFLTEKFNFEDEIINSDSYISLQQTMRDIVEMICDYVDDNVENDNIGKQIIEYIKENIHKDISVSDVRDKFGVSASYISKVLKSEYNTSFKLYIDRLRVDAAKKMMDEDKNILIKDIAQSLGYDNAISFIRMFKRVEGISPGTYQKMH